jgi:decaprenyl-phosphate phosphoribosyltransferase
LISADPRQWPKNLLVFAAPLFAYRLDKDVWLRPGCALVAFCLISSAIDLLNESLDVAADRANSSKRYRSIAAVSECIPFT